MIPKIIHFIYPVTDKTRPWSIVNTMAVKTAMEHYKDHDIFIWTNAPEAVPDFKDVIAIKCELPTHIGETEIVWPQYVSDVMRLQILHKHGGIYMDTDIISLKTFEPKPDCLNISWETSKRVSVSNAMMASPPNNTFVEVWLSKMEESINNPLWAYGGVVLPQKLSLNPFLKDDFFMWGTEMCCPLDLSVDWLFSPDAKDMAKERITDAYAIHVFETFRRDIIKDITPEWIKQNDCLFSELYQRQTAPSIEE